MQEVPRPLHAKSLKGKKAAFFKFNQTDISILASTQRAFLKSPS